MSSIEDFLSRLIGLAFAAAIAGFVLFAVRGDLSVKQSFVYGLLVVFGILFALMVLGSLKRWLFD
jgi:Na+-transporting NADH:ubiquinone oxidoreductase subunit NqrE